MSTAGIFNKDLNEIANFLKDGANVEWKPLGFLSDVIDSLHQTPQYSNTGKHMIRVTDIKGGYVQLSDTFRVSDEIFDVFTKKYLPKKDDLVMSRVGSYGNVGIIPENDISCMGQNTVVINPKINNKFLYYYLTSHSAQNFIERNVSGGNQKTLSLKSIKSIPVPAISSDKQRYIVDILDKFDTLINSISDGLPREIKLRQQQYEYYRDMLFNFPKNSEVK